MRNLFVFASICLTCVLGLTFQSHAQNAPVQTRIHTLGANSWSFECPKGSACGTRGTWITTTAQPGATRLWSAGTAWDYLAPTATTYNWTFLDTWLDLIAKHAPRTAIYTFGHVPCWIASGPCWNAPGEIWSPSPPSDLTVNGSPAFTAFVTTLTQHCSPAGHCVKDYIKYWEMWNEANLTGFWTGTQSQLYDLFKPVIPIIRSNIPGAKILTPPSSGGAAIWTGNWLALENANGRLSDYYSFHIYLENSTPEDRMSIIDKMVATKNSNGWTMTPWLNSETNFVGATFACAPQYTPSDCQGQLVRWHVLQFAYQGGAGGAYQVGWYNWPSIVSGGYDTYYDTMMQWLTGATFTGSCTNNGTVYTCPLTEAKGIAALIVWDSAGNSDYTPATQYTDYKQFNGTYGGTTVPISAGQTTLIGQIPIMFETVK